MSLRRAAALGGSSLAGAACLWQVGLLVRLWAARVHYLWDVEWLESTSLYQAYRVMHGLPTYGPPRDGFLAQNHPPLYPIVLAAIGRVVGLDYPMARTFSLVCFFAAAAVVVRALLRRFGKNPRGFGLSALAVGCAAAGAPLCLAYYDLVREDAMALFLCVAAASLVSEERALSAKRTALVAFVIAAIVYTRLPAVFFAVWVVVYSFARHRRSGAKLAMVATALCGVILVGLLFMSHGWYWLLTIATVQDQHVRSERVSQALRMLVSFAPFVLALPPLAVALAIARRLSAPATLWTGMLSAALPASLLPWAKVGGFENDLMPLAFLTGPAAAFLLGDLLGALRARPRFCASIEAVVLVGGAGFLALRSWDGARWTPTPAMREGAARLNARVASLDGGAVAPRHPFLSVRNGHTTLGWSDMPYLDMVWSNYRDLDLGGYIDRAHARYVLVSGNELFSTARELSTRFQLEDRVKDGPGTIIGDPSAIRYILRSNDDEAGGHVVFDFESLDGWTGSLGAFTIADPRPSWQQAIEGAVGRHVVDSYLPNGRGDRSRGMVISPPFLIDRPHLSLRVGGGTRDLTRVELRVEGRVERTAVSIWEQQETLTRVVWDVSAFAGKGGQLALVDEDAGAWGHLTCNHVVLY
jgi:hypothetical protein